MLIYNIKPRINSNILQYDATKTLHFKTNLKGIPYNITILYFNDNIINFVIYLNR